MKQLLLVLLLTGYSVATATPPDSPVRFTHHAIYLEGGGPGLLYSINYDYRFVPMFGLRVGFSSFTFEYIVDVSVVTVPLVAECILFDGNHHLEIGAGIVPVRGQLTGNSVFGRFEGTPGSWATAGTGVFGYRFQPRESGFLFKAEYTPMFGKGEVLQWGGVSIGWAF